MIAALPGACARTPAAADDGPLLAPEPIADEPLQPLPASPAVDPRRAALGARLFADRRLSVDDSLACADCHPLDRGGADGRAHSSMIGGRPASVNTPTVFNAVFSYSYNWTGAYPSLEAELDAPLGRAMGNDAASIAARLAREPDYAPAFRAAYPGQGLTEATLRDAIATFERTLATPGARFDRWLRGERDALSPDERAGYELFRSYGCASCHQGANVGGNIYQRMGVLGDYFAGRGGPPTPGDQGRYAATHDPHDLHVFRVPSLRNVAATAPYFHDGSAPTLEAAIDAMARYQLGRSLEPHDVAQIAAFLRTLTGTYQGRPVTGG